MKKFFTFIMLLFCVDCYAADDIFQLNPYLQGAATAWASVLTGFGTGGEIATRMNAAHSDDLLAFGNMVSVLAFNDTSLTMFAALQHTDMAYSAMLGQNFTRRSDCDFDSSRCPRGAQLIIDGGALGGFGDYDSNNNSDFKTRTTGLTVRARGYVTDGFSLGIGYARTWTDTRETLVDTDATTNSITLLAQYISRGGFFVNTAINAGRITWDNDKSIAGISDDSAYNTDFYSGQMTTGVNVARRHVFFTPYAGVRYLRMKSESYIDAAAQDFQKWFYGALTAQAGTTIGAKLTFGTVQVRPSVKLGAGYDVISNGTDRAAVRLINNAVYDMPIAHPARTSLNAGAAVAAITSWGQFGIEYRMDTRSDYVSHSGMLNVKFAF